MAAILEAKFKRKVYSNCWTLYSINIQSHCVVQVQSSFKVATEVDKVVKKADGILAFIGWDMEYKSWEIRCSCIKCCLATCGVLVVVGMLQK